MTFAEEATRIVHPDADTPERATATLPKIYVVTYRYEGRLEILADNEEDARFQAEHLKEQDLMIRLGNLEMDEPKERPPITGVLAELNQFRREA
jgi:hypothetical protein